MLHLLDLQKANLKFREEMNSFLGKHPQSPLERKEQKKFTGLPYYEWSAIYIVEASAVYYPENTPTIQMQTSTNQTASYRPYARLSFEIAGQAGELTLYSDEDGTDFFLPFKDATNGVASYGAGRYLDNHRPSLWEEVGDKWMIDFNYAYNPTCAYNSSYSCPIPPPENHLPLPIMAGEQYHAS